MAAAVAGLKSVQLDSQVVLKIVQHCNESLPQLVTGQLLGLDVGHTLEVTDCFAFPVSVCLPPGGVQVPWNDDLDCTASLNKCSGSGRGG